MNAKILWAYMDMCTEFDIKPDWGDLRAFEAGVTANAYLAKCEAHNWTPSINGLNNFRKLVRLGLRQLPTYNWMGWHNSQKNHNLG